MVEWDYRPRHRHLGNVLTRRREGYHADLLNAIAAGRAGGVQEDSPKTIHTTAVRIKQPGLERHHAMARDQQDEWGGFAAGAYTWDLDQSSDCVSLRLHRRAAVDGREVSVERAVEVRAGDHGLAHRIQVRANGPDALPARIAEEWGLGVFGAPEEIWVEAAGRRHSLHELGALPETDHVVVNESHSGLVLTFELSQPAAVWTFPLITISNSGRRIRTEFPGRRACAHPHG